MRVKIERGRHGFYIHILKDYMSITIYDKALELEMDEEALKR